MRIKLGSGLLLINILAIILVLAISFVPGNIVRIILGIPFVLFFPGYALMVALYPRKSSLDGITLLALSLGLSIAIVVLSGLILNYTPFGIRLESILYSIFAFMVIMSLIGWLRLRNLPQAEHQDISFTLSSPSLGAGVLERTLSIILIMGVLGAVGMIGYNIANPKTGQKFTEFYILGQEGNAATYPLKLAVGQEGKILVGIVNNEYLTVNYRVEMRINGVKNTEVTGITLEHKGRWENKVSFTPNIAGDSQKVEFLLFKADETKPLLDPLRLWINVSAK